MQSESDDRGSSHEARRRTLRGIRLVAFDVDGTLTTGDVIYVGDEESQVFSVHDGQGLVWLRKAGVALAWITGRGSRPTERRAQELGVTELHMGVGPKSEVLQEIQERLGISPEETASMGDDLPDLGLAQRSIFFAAPSDARPEVRERAQLVTRASAGHGAARELAEAILASKGCWKELVEGFQARPQ